MSLVGLLNASSAAATVRTPFVKRTVPLGTRRHTNELSDGKLLRCGKPQTHTHTRSRFTFHAQRLAIAPHIHNVVVPPPAPLAAPSLLTLWGAQCWQFSSLVGCLLLAGDLSMCACLYAPPRRSLTLDACFVVARLFFGFLANARARASAACFELVDGCLAGYVARPLLVGCKSSSACSFK